MNKNAAVALIALTLVSVSCSSTPSRPAPAPPPPPGAGSPFVSLREIDSFDGRNITEKAMAFVRSKQPNLGHDDCHAQATVLLTQLR